jgi:hypothetical protein
VQIVLAGLAEGYFGLALVDTTAGAIAVAVTVATNMAGAIGVAAALTTGVEQVGAIVPTAQALFVVAALSLLTALYFGRGSGLLL